MFKEQFTKTAKEKINEVYQSWIHGTKEYWEAHYELDGITEGIRCTTWLIEHLDYNDIEPILDYARFVQNQMWEVRQHKWDVR